MRDRSVRLWHSLAATLGLLLGFAVGPAHAKPVHAEHVTAELVGPDTPVIPGTPFIVNLKLTMEQDWHVYWRNPGDSGLAPSIKWDLPRGVTAGEILWPYPELIELEPLASYGYHETVELPVEITPSADLKPGTTLELKAKADWLVCKEICLPGEADLAVTVTIGSVEPGAQVSAPDYPAEIPRQFEDWKVEGAVEGDNVVLNVTPPPGFDRKLKHFRFYPYDESIVEYAAPQEIEATPTGYTLTTQKSLIAEGPPPRIAGILVTPDGWDEQGGLHALEFGVPMAGATVELKPSTGATQAAKAPESTTSLPAIPARPPMGILTALLFAFLGGMILNLMPCVLPVLSLKVFGMVKQAGGSRQAIFSHGLVFGAGVLLSFWVLAGSLIALRAGGQQLGWGFQLQSPMFLVFLSSFLFLFGLNMLGVFEITTALSGVAGKATGKEGYGGSFLNGVTATVVATPCTAPFMGSALGFSLSQPTWVVWLIFTALGVGMALPYVVLASQPQLLKFLPKPGEWMETFKQVMGFVLLATVIWLAWVLGTLTGSNGVVALMATFLLLGVAGWILGRWCHGGARVTERKIGSVLAALLVAAGIAVGWTITARSTPPSGSGETEQQGLIAWERFTPERVTALRAAGIPVLIDFTADWCLTCKVNERVAFGSNVVQQRLVDLGVATLKADWTTRDDTITEALALYGRNSVPVYILHPPGGDPVLLPEVLTPAIVLNALSGLESPET